MARTYTVVGMLCSSRKAARLALAELRAQDPVEGLNWGLVDIAPPGETASRISKIHLPPPPALLKRLEGLLSKQDIRKTKAGAEALKLVRTSLRRK